MMAKFWTSFQYAPELNPKMDRITAPGTYRIQKERKKKKNNINLHSKSPHSLKNQNTKKKRLTSISSPNSFWINCKNVISFTNKASNAKLKKESFCSHDKFSGIDSKMVKKKKLPE